LSGVSAALEAAVRPVRPDEQRRQGAPVTSGGQIRSARASALAGSQAGRGRPACTCRYPRALHERLAAQRADPFRQVVSTGGLTRAVPLEAGDVARAVFDGVVDDGAPLAPTRRSRTFGLVFADLRPCQTALPQSLAFPHRARHPVEGLPGGGQWRRCGRCPTTELERSRALREEPGIRSVHAPPARGFWIFAGRTGSPP
jgi:hypothetical protein